MSQGTAVNVVFAILTPFFVCQPYTGQAHPATRWVYVVGYFTFNSNEKAQVPNTHPHTN